MFVGITTLIVMNSLIFGFVTWLPSFFVQQGLGIVTSFNYSLIMSLGAPLGSVMGAWAADFWGRKPSIIGASSVAIVLGAIYPFIRNPNVLMASGFLLMIFIYILVSVLFAIYIPELFPTGVRLRAAGICNTFGRGATILTPFLTVVLFKLHGIGGVLSVLDKVLNIPVFENP